MYDSNNSITAYLSKVPPTTGPVPGTLNISSTWNTCSIQKNVIKFNTHSNVTMMFINKDNTDYTDSSLNSPLISKFTAQGSRDVAVVRALASHRCGPGSIPGPGVTCGLSLLLVLVPAPRVFLRVLRFSSLHKNQHCYM